MESRTHLKTVKITLNIFAEQWEELNLYGVTWLLTWLILLSIADDNHPRISRNKFSNIWTTSNINHTNNIPTYLWKCHNLSKSGNPTTKISWVILSKKDITTSWSCFRSLKQNCNALINTYRIHYKVPFKYKYSIWVWKGTFQLMQILDLLKVSKFQNEFMKS